MKKHLYVATLAIIVFAGCKKDKVIYKSFSEKELEFVNYVTGQELKIIDSNGATHVLEQSLYSREFREFVGLFGKTSDFQEKYEVGFNSLNNSPPLNINLYLYGEFYPYTKGQIVIEVSNYKTSDFVSQLDLPLDNVLINTVSYQNVYRLKAYKYGLQINNTDTVTIYWNKQFGFIQLYFPNGKAFTRAD